MGGIYGDMLSAFGELLQDYAVFAAPAKIGAGYGKRYNERTVTGYFYELTSRERGVSGGVLADDQQALFYEQHDFLTNKSRIRKGDFFENEDEIYVFTGRSTRGREGGFTKWVLRLVSGFTDRQSRDSGVDLAADFR